MSALTEYPIDDLDFHCAACDSDNTRGSQAVDMPPTADGAPGYRWSIDCKECGHRTWRTSAEEWFYDLTGTTTPPMPCAQSGCPAGQVRVVRHEDTEIPPEPQWLSMSPKKRPSLERKYQIRCAGGHLAWYSEAEADPAPVGVYLSANGLM
ncbi:MAG TPA: hypothetical protein VHA75_07995 [Rugosimonospora sp.]|nr:hypothetical protein [Rugosimonospora sp.]